MRDGGERRHSDRPKSKMAMGLRGEGGGSAIAAHRTTPFMTIDNELDEKKKKMILFLVLRKKERKKEKQTRGLYRN